MSYNGSGTFNINSTGQPVVAGTVISSSAFNALTTDLATGLTTAITKDGQTTTTARITFAQGITSSLVTDSSSTSTGSIITAGGVGIAKNLYVGGSASFSAQPIFSSLTASSAVATDASKGLVSVTNTGTGNNVLATSPTLVTPILGTPQSVTLTSATGLPLSTGVTGTLPVVNGGTGLTTIPHTVQVFTSSSGTYTTPANCKAIFVQLVGGGGGGGGGANTTYFTGGGGGGSGGYVQKLINSPSATYSYAVGATAAGGAAGATGVTGTAGANTTFSTFTASGGGAGTGGTGSNGFGGSGGAGGAASGGDINIAGSDGAAGGPGVNGVVGGPAGSGGSSFFGGSGTGGVNSGGSAGKTNSGSGGGGGSNGAAGAGAAGIIIVTEYYV
jgi:hypothetical protein